MILPYMRGALGLLVLLVIAWLLSGRKRPLPMRQIGWGIALQVLLALFILKTPSGAVVFDFIRRVAARLISFSGAGGSFLFGLLGTPDAAQSTVTNGAGTPVSLGFSVAFQVLPIIVFFSALIAICYHFGILQRVVQVFAFIMRKSMRISGAESLAVAANIFVGNVESPMVVRPYLAEMTHSELGTVMVAGFGTIAGSVMAAYVGFGVDAGHLLAASVMSAPAAVVIAKLMFPETETPKTMNGADIDTGDKAVNVIDAAANGAIQGLKIAATVGAMLIAFLSLLALINYPLGLISVNGAPLSLGRIFGYLFAPVAWCMGVESKDVLAVGDLLGTKVAVNELVGYLKLVALKNELAERSYVIATFALCGFANFGSIAIAIGGIGAIVPNRRTDLARIGLKAMLGGALASFMTATIAGMML